MKNNYKKILITGIPLSGKTTQAKRIGGNIINMNILSNLTNKSENNFEKFKVYTTIPNHLKSSIKKTIEDDNFSNLYFNFIVLDGILFDIHDAKYLLKNNLISKLIILDLPEEISRERNEILRDNKFKLKYSNLFYNQRLKIFQDKTILGIDYLKEQFYKKSMSFLNIDATNSIDDIANEISSYLY